MAGACMAWRDPERQNGTAAGIGVLLGADGVTGRRSGIGRMTLEFAQTLRSPPSSVGDPRRLADLALLIGDAVSPPDMLDRATRPPMRHNAAPVRCWPMRA